MFLLVPKSAYSTNTIQDGSQATGLVFVSLWPFTQLKKLCFPPPCGMVIWFPALSRDAEHHSTLVNHCKLPSTISNIIAVHYEKNTLASPLFEFQLAPANLTFVNLSLFSRWPVHFFKVLQSLLSVRMVTCKILQAWTSIFQFYCLSLSVAIVLAITITWITTNVSLIPTAFPWFKSRIVY